MAHLGKRIRAANALVEEGYRYPLDDALEILPKTASAKFDESIDLAIRLGVNPRKADQMVRGAISLPYGVGKEVRVVVFAEGDAAREAEEAGADFVGSNDLVARIQDEGWVDFDKAIATRSMMAKVGRLGRILGPRGLMPNPKSGTVVQGDNIGQVVRDVKGGRVDFRVDKAGIVHAPIGQSDMPADKLRANLLALMQTIIRMRPASAKGVYLRSVSISATMGPGIWLDTNDIARLAADVN